MGAIFEDYLPQGRFLWQGQGSRTARQFPLAQVELDFFRNVPGAPGWLSGWASAFGSGRDPKVLGLSPTLGSLRGACFSLCLSLCLTLCVSHE